MLCCDFLPRDDRKTCKYSIGTQQVPSTTCTAESRLRFGCAIEGRDSFSGFAYYPYIIDELLALLDKLLEREKGLQIDWTV